MIDNSSQLILWQAGLVGDWTFRRYAYDTSSAMPLLLENSCVRTRRRTQSTFTRRPQFLGANP